MATKAVLPGHRKGRWSPVQTGPGPLAEEGGLSFLYNTHQEIGGLSNILYSKGLVFAPSEIDMSIRPGWFWHPEEEPHSLERLFQTYLNSVGNNAVLHLNLPPNREGLLDEKDVKRLEEFSAMLKKEFRKVSRNSQSHCCSQRRK